jgi:hypothetical protein
VVPAFGCVVLKCVCLCLHEMCINLCACVMETYKSWLCGCAIERTARSLSHFLFPLCVLTVFVHRARGAVCCACLCYPKSLLRANKLDHLSLFGHAPTFGISSLTRRTQTTFPVLWVFAFSALFSGDLSRFVIAGFFSKL